jgi:acyl phosphate:glycerol-3-phosphate acyltransferase
MGNVAVVIVAYLIGSIAFAVLVSKAFRLPDPHTYGSGNPGATNVLRTGNRAAALLTLFGDALKGFIAVLMTEIATRHFDLPKEAIALSAIAVFMGHLFPVFHKFKGGKGVATAAGILFAMQWQLGLLTLLTWAVIAMFFRYSSLAALIAAIFAPLCTYFLTKSPEMLAAVSAISLLLIWRHRINIRKLIAGEETRIGEQKPEIVDAKRPDSSAGGKSA